MTLYDDEKAFLAAETGMDINTPLIDLRKAYFAQGGGIDVNAITFVVSGDLAAGSDLTNHRPMLRAVDPIKVTAALKTAPVGAALTFQLYKNGVDAMLNTALTIAAGATTGTSVDWVNGMTLAAGDYVTLTCVTIGTTTPGADLTIVLQVEAT